tara:strand:- start:163 stop:315 length:153 start_codon:yes stop_codon:yes gene_type:complete
VEFLIIGSSSALMGVLESQRREQGSSDSSSGSESEEDASDGKGKFKHVSL